MNKRRTGAFYEEQAALFLKKQGLDIIERNYRCRLGEIDLIARDGEYLVFVEVKSRFNKNSGNALEAVTPGKQKIISKVAAYYLTVNYHTLDLPCRFDVVGIEEGQLYWVRDAFPCRG